VVAALRQLGLRSVLLTGDNRRTAAAVAAQLGIEEVAAEVLPAGKVDKIVVRHKRVCVWGGGAGGRAGRKCV
jgi:P-type E1-E2 ATPase